MALKKPHQRNNVTTADAEALANRLADRPYGEEKLVYATQDLFARTTISLPQCLLREIEDRALSNKRAGIEPKNVSALIREALNSYLLVK
ncbi:hypothetical protein SK355_11720 (plasmid) [Candidatus Fukatsuia symbiotica]|uniref:CopG family transcriptional regulator n=1 Tax=Candidatus Fukatsuia symbiotica TaxID=1878942 RepID=A0A2U8I929_9GAMM|nr:hypothetical protein [Candidatus Fukatsuia symbiotica]AWK15578.1 hypothetical protein CCS41_14255 [Candidatus Fukatsuia symbiotica]MEA9445844.1 hypothetical protein [Candidatus Fukatsuia symbiotica]